MNEHIFLGAIAAYTLLMMWHSWLIGRNVEFRTWTTSIYGLEKFGEEVAKKPLVCVLKIMAVGTTGWSMYFYWRGMKFIRSFKAP